MKIITRTAKQRTVSAVQATHKLWAMPQKITQALVAANAMAVLSASQTSVQRVRLAHTKTLLTTSSVNRAQQEHIRILQLKHTVKLATLTQRHLPAPRLWKRVIATQVTRI